MQERCPACNHLNPPNSYLCESCSAVGLCAQDEDAEAAPSFVLIARRLWDGMSDTCASDATHGMCVAVTGPIIAWIGRADRIPETLSSLEVIDLRASDATIMPGLIDAHIHIEFDPRYALHDQPRLRDAELMQRMQQRARNMLAHGITIARDLGGKGGALALRDAINRSSCLGPRLLCAGQVIASDWTCLGMTVPNCV